MGSLGAEVLVRDKDVSSCSTTWSWDETLIFGIWFPNSLLLQALFQHILLQVCFFSGKRADIPSSASFIHVDFRKYSLTRSSVVKKDMLLAKLPFPFANVKGDEFCLFVGLGKVCIDIDKLFFSENSGAVLSNINLNNVQFSWFVNIFIFQLVSLYIYA